MSSKLFACRLVQSAIAITAFATTTNTFADENSSVACSGSLSLISNYRFRGLTQTNSDPALQGSLECAHTSGFYAGLWGSNVSWLSDLSSADVPISNSLELDYYGGYRGAFAEGWGFDVGVYGYYYPGDYPHGFIRPYTTELFAGLTYATAGIKYWHSVTNAFGFGDSKNSGYLEANYNPAIGSGWTLNLHAGHQRIDSSSDFDYSDWKVGVSKDLGKGRTLAAAYVDTNADRVFYTNPYGEYVGDAVVTVSIAQAF